MITIDLDDLMVEIDDGTIKHVGAPTAAATIKLYDVDDAAAREFGDSRIKLELADDEDNEVEAALTPEAAATLAEELARLREGSRVFE